MERITRKRLRNAIAQLSKLMGGSPLYLETRSSCYGQYTVTIQGFPGHACELHNRYYTPQQLDAYISGAIDALCYVRDSKKSDS